MTKSLTKQDVKEIVTELNDLQTKQLRIEFNNIYNIISQHDIRFDKLEQDMENLHNEMSVFEDDVMRAIGEMRDEIAILTGYKDDIEDHGVRIGKLEQKVLPVKN